MQLQLLNTSTLYSSAVVLHPSALHSEYHSTKRRAIDPWLFQALLLCHLIPLNVLLTCPQLCVQGETQSSTERLDRG